MTETIRSADGTTIAFDRYGEGPPLILALAPTLVYDTTMMADHGLLGERAPKVTAPLLVIDGGDSPPWARECAEAVAAAVPGARRHTIPGQTHEVSTDALAPVLLEYYSAG